MKAAFISGYDLAIPAELERKISEDGHILIKIPYHLRFGDTQITDAELSIKEFYMKMESYRRETGKLPETSQLTPFDLVHALERASRERAEHAFIFPVFKGYSGSYNSAVIAAEMVPSINTTVIDTGSISAGNGFLVWETYKGISSGKIIEDIVQGLESSKNKILTAIFANDPEYLRERIGSAAPVAKALSLKFCLSVEGGIIKPMASFARTQSKAIENILGYMEKNAGKGKIVAYVAHADNETLAAFAAVQISERFNLAEDDVFNGVGITGIPSAIGRYTGPGACGVFMYKVRQAP